MINFVSIHTKFRKACQILKLNKQPMLKFEEKYISQYNQFNNEIILNINKIITDNLRIKLLPFIKTRLIENIDIIMFSLYHELGHCFQYQKFPRWFLIYYKELREFQFNTGIIGDEDKKYRELKIEKCADKIADILFKKLEKKDNVYRI